MHIILVDLPNFYNTLARQFIAIDEPDKVRDYFLKWLELDILSESINRNCGAEEKLLIGTYVYYSNRAMGRNKARIQPQELRQFAKRTNRESGVSVYEAGVPGEQKELFEFKCKKCRTENTVPTTSEKGIDTTIITHLFETMDNWQVATIVSHDADYCPAINALRKKGKHVYAAGEPDGASPALIRDCYSFIDVFKNYLNTDIELFKAFMPNGDLSRFVKEVEKNEAIRISSEFKTSQESWWFSLKAKEKEIDNREFIENLEKWTTRISNAFPFIKATTDHHPGEFTYNLSSKFNKLHSECLKRKIQDDYIDFPRNGIELR